MAGGRSLPQQRATHGVITSDSPQSTASVVVSAHTVYSTLKFIISCILDAYIHCLSNQRRQGTSLIPRLSSYHGNDSTYDL